VHRNVTVGAGYDYVDVSNKTHVGPISGPSITAANQVVHTVPAQIHMVTARVNFLFGPTERRPH
jgi:opacity protein-like surface antigen